MQAASSIPHQSVYQIVTEQIIKQLESGVAPWHKPWRTEPPCNLVSGQQYRGINVFLLATQGYGSRYWLTLNQANRARRPHSQGRARFVNRDVLEDRRRENRDRDGDGNEHKTKPFLLRFYRVFNVEQSEGIADKLGLGNASPRIPESTNASASLRQMPNPPAMVQDARAWYRPANDTVGMPSRQAFGSAEEYYSTLFHELTHSTGHPSRIGREGIEKLNTFGSESYSKEELIAEMGAAMLAGVAGIERKTLANSAAYLKSWIDVLKSDARMVVFAASQAQKAADYIQGGAR